MENSESKCVHVDFEKLAAQEHACCIVITCGQPTDEGKMNVELSYEGDPDLAAYLLESAQGFIDVSD